MSGCRKYNKVTNCTPEFIESREVGVCEQFEVCLPFGRVLSFNGQCLELSGTPSIADGEYGIIIVENGCIVGARRNPVFEYTPGPCAPASNPCGGSGESGVVLQPNNRNLLTFDASGRLGAFVTIEAGAGMSVTGTGTAANPFVISANAAAANRTYVQSGDTQAIQVAGTGASSNPYIINLAETGLEAGTYNGLRVDRYGRVVGVTTSSVSSINSIVQGPGITVNQQGSTATVSLANTGVEPDTYKFGGYSVTVGLAGQISKVKQDINIQAQRFDPYYNLVTVDQHGSITAIQSVTRLSDSQFSKAFAPRRSNTILRLSTNTQGPYKIVYTGVIAMPEGSTTTATTSGFIDLPDNYGIVIDNDSQECYGWYDATFKKITAIHCLTSSEIQAGEHVIELVGPDTFTDRGFLDVSIVKRGG